MDHLIIYNPSAGRKGGQDHEAVAAAFQRRRLPHRLVITSHSGHARELTAELGPDFDAVVVVGGDGTLHEVIQTLDPRRHRLGVLPWGTGNDFAYMQEWPEGVEDCVDRIAAAGERRVDVGVWEGEHGDRTRPTQGRFHNNVGFGFEAVVNAASHRIQRLHGPAVYVAALLQSVPRFKSHAVRLTWDKGEYRGHAALLSVGNGKRVGGCFHLTPDARQDDGKLDLVYTGRMSLLRMMFILPRCFRGGHIRNPGVHTLQTPSIQVESADGIPVYIDGEFLAHDVTRLQLQSAPGFLRTF